jgi:hypothetical protein
MPVEKITSMSFSPSWPEDGLKPVGGSAFAALRAMATRVLRNGTSWVRPGPLAQQPRRLLMRLNREGEPPRRLARLSWLDHVFKSGLKRSEASSIEENTSEQESRNLFGSASITTGRP